MHANSFLPTSADKAKTPLRPLINMLPTKNFKFANLHKTNGTTQRKRISTPALLHPLTDYFQQAGFVHNVTASVAFASDKTQRRIHNAPPVVAAAGAEFYYQSVVHAAGKSKPVVTSVGKLFGAQFDGGTVLFALFRKHLVAHRFYPVEVLLYHLHCLFLGGCLREIGGEIVDDCRFYRVFDALVVAVVAVGTNVNTQKFRIGWH